MSAPPLIGPQPLPSAAAANPVRQPDGSFLFVPSSARVVPGVVYRYTLFTHCGVTPTGFDFDGSYWDPVAEVTPKLADPEDAGTIQLVSPDEAVYTTAGGGIIGLRQSSDRQPRGFPLRLTRPSRCYDPRHARGPAARIPRPLRLAP